MVRSNSARRAISDEARKLEHGKPCQVSEIGTSHGDRPVWIVVGYVVPVNFQFPAPTVFALRGDRNLRHMHPTRRRRLSSKAEPGLYIVNGRLNPFVI